MNNNYVFVTEVEYRVRGNRLAEIRNKLKNWQEPRETLIFDRYYLLDTNSQTYRRLRIRQNKWLPPEDLRRYSYHEHSKSVLLDPSNPRSDEFPIEAKRQLKEDEYMKLLRSYGVPILVVRGVRKDIFLDKDRNVHLDEVDGIRMCFDTVDGLGEFTEFEIELFVTRAENPYGEAMFKDRRKAKQRLVTFVGKLGITPEQFEPRTYAQILWELGYRGDDYLREKAEGGHMGTPISS